MNDSKEHYPVLLKETISSLNIKPNGIYVDLTLGMGGHSSEILKHLTTGHLYSFDKDSFAIEKSYERLSKISNNFTLIKSDFKDIKSKLEELNIYKVDGIIADLGISSPQIDNKERGFSYNKDAQLDMRMDQEQELDAKYIVNQYSQSDLENILWKYADVKLSKRVAKAIVDNRPINGTLELVEVIKSAYPAALLRQKNPAKAVFQAIRIEVNNELSSLETMLSDAIKLLKPNSTLSIITFHSIEDRIVKNFFKSLTISKIPSKLPIMEVKKYQTRQISPSKSEIEENRRSKSAKLRIITKNE
ncbi:16S rRNA (cytosine(1402)-N(4))-methyltransferase RsmH [Mycoplasma sp. CSL10137]|uniref:16S rRNA (cytosine(1402)-N(4))-methyltransferase RsmH n=1 Tax=unclassified Mycoplasma TaxID=2683645 RepID=UPI00197C91D8|nr:MULTISPECIES: 16S rRNA (cytosine(1402)-N(4))-methyltransferase RsmH [unclassified Mycoplasma]MBN4083265.1 16S rRNA (cytosine(1402)-N(4))-methyltransferase RsmH [Mycoplasma sp. CSL10137]MBN4084434.1 16S rRNA (cytosine(1402)-N(4))-methyltransferase RsmH [Mycoplasma sp. CSL10166]MBU4692919.1 16S rRNA (cytosine(1402)-N(4))-methyltransferase RsmH [Mycoplasma sp. CSL7491-lung]